MTIKAVIFDVGGVIVPSPLTGIAAYERRLGLPKHYINVGITALGASGAFHQFENGDIDFDQFIARFGPELSQTHRLNEAYRKYCQKVNMDYPPLPQKVTIDSRDLFRVMFESTGKVDPRMEHVIRRIRSTGRYKVAALTNNFPRGKASQDPLQNLLQPDDVLVKLFDAYFESSKIGMRKPDPRAFLYACDQLGMQPSECVFLDDIGLNVKSARQLGMKTIRVGPDNDVVPAIKELGQLLHLDLTSPSLTDDAKAKL